LNGYAVIGTKDNRKRITVDRGGELRGGRLAHHRLYRSSLIEHLH